MSKFGSTSLRVAAALVAVASTADAKPRSVVVLDFNGARTLADTGRAAVLKHLATTYDIINANSWDAAKAEAARTKHGPEQWRAAARSTCVDVVIDGWVTDDRRNHVLTIVVSEASSGNEIDEVTVKLSEAGITPESMKTIATSLDEVLEYIAPDGGVCKDYRLPPASVPRNMIGASADDGNDRRTKTSDTVLAAAPPDDKQTRQNLMSVFPTPIPEIEVISDNHAPHMLVPTPKIMVSGGAYMGSRQLEFTAAEQTGPMEYVGTQVQGLQVQAAVYPWPLQKMNGKLSGLGISVKFAKSINSFYTFDDGNTTADYTVDQSMFEGKIHYRYPINDSFTLDSHVGYGRSQHVIQDAPVELEVPDVSYEWLSAGVEIELAITDRASVSVGGQYLKMIGDQGDLNSADWYGSGSTSGIELRGGFIVPLPANIYVHGELDYRRITTNFNGDGTLTQLWGVTDATDTTVGAAVDVGIQF